MSKSKTDVEWIMYRSAQIPAPGQYNFKEHTPNGGKFNMVPAPHFHVGLPSAFFLFLSLLAVSFPVIPSRSLFHTVTVVSARSVSLSLSPSLSLSLSRFHWLVHLCARTLSLALANLRFLSLSFYLSFFLYFSRNPDRPRH